MELERIGIPPYRRQKWRPWIYSLFSCGFIYENRTAEWCDMDFCGFSFNHLTSCCFRGEGLILAHMLLYEYTYFWKDKYNNNQTLRRRTIIKTFFFLLYYFNFIWSP
jgi:hypothetical protein